MFKVVGDTLEYDGWTVGTLGNMPATVRKNLVDTLEGVDAELEDEHCHDCEMHKEEIGELEGELNEARDEIVTLKEQRDEAEGEVEALTEERDEARTTANALRAILQLPPETEP